MSYCPACGVDQTDEATECSECGASFEPAPTLSGAGATRSRDIPSDDKLATQLRRALSPRIQILRLLAGGGMSVVYLGREPSLRRLVAIKVLAEDLTKDDVARARFTREAEAAAGIARSSRYFHLPGWHAPPVGSPVHHHAVCRRIDLAAGDLVRQGCTRAVCQSRRWRDRPGGCLLRTLVASFIATSSRPTS